MKKYLPAFLFLIFIATAVFPQNDQNLYNDAKKSVVYLQHAIYLDPELCTDAELFKKIETEFEKELLGSYLALASGSGFIIDKDGTFLTNRHVVLRPDLMMLKEQVAADIEFELTPELKGSIPSVEFKTFMADLKKMITEGEYRLSATVEDDLYSDVSIKCISAEDQPDLALAKINTDRSFIPLKLLENTSFGEILVGADVFSLGYPLGSFMDSLFEDRVVTLNKGTISAIRTEALNIQHSAAISHGNSGGPLVDARGNVIGVNTAIIDPQKGNSLFYAEGADHVRSFLSDNGYSDILRWNSRLAVQDSAGGEGINYNVLGEIETSVDLVVDAEKGAEVYIDDELIGIAPMYVLLTKPLSSIRISSSTGVFTGNLRLMGSLKGTTTIKPSFLKPPVSVSFDGIDDVEVFADERLLGSTPLRLELPADDYTFTFKKTGHYFEPRSSNLVSGENIVDINELKSFQIKIQNLPSVNKSELMDFISGRVRSEKSVQPDLICSKDDIEVRFSQDEPIYLPDGNWLLRLDGVPESKEMQIIFDVKGKPTSIDLNGFLQGGKLTIRNFPEDADIWIDGELLPQTAVNPLDLPLGISDVFIWKEGFKPLSVDITIRPEDNAYITWTESPGHDQQAGGSIALGVVEMIFGGVCFVGLAPALASVDSYQLMTYVGIAGIASVVAAIIEFGSASAETELYNADIAKLNELKGGM